jgi:hypothetical protein
MDCIRFLYGLFPLVLFSTSGEGSFPGKRPIYPKDEYDAPSGDNPKDFPDGFLPVLMQYDGEKLVSTDKDQRLQVNFSDQGEESDHDLSGMDFDEEEYYYLFFTKQELTQAGIDISRKPGFNYWNAEALRWDPRGHVLENCWAIHRFIAVQEGFYPVCYRLNKNEGNVRSENSSLPFFTQDDVRNAFCFQPFFGNKYYDPREDFDLAYFFIEFSLDELRAAGVEVPADLTGYRFNPESATFEEVEKPATLCGWDSITESWMPFCTAEDDDGSKCTSGKLAFPWESSMSNGMLRNNNNVFTYMTKDHTESRRNSKLMRNLFSQKGGPYCDCNCFCSNCRHFHLPWEKSSHRDYDGKNVLGEWTCDGF